MIVRYTYFFTVLALSSLLIHCSCSENNLNGPIFQYSHNNPIDYQDPLAEKNFFLLTQISASTGIAQLISKDFYFSKLNAQIHENLEYNLDDCSDLNSCVDLLCFSESDISTISVRLSQLIMENPEFDGFVNNTIRSSGCYSLFADRNNEQYIGQVWELTAKAINNILEVYGKGAKPMYPEIDSISYDKSSTAYQDLVKTQLQDCLNESMQGSLFYDLPMKFAISLLELNSRDEAGRYEPMHNKVNRACYDHLPNVPWDNYLYSFILVPGDSPNSPGDSINLSEGGKSRLKRGVQLFRDSIAPILILSGGHVRPFQTPYSEAIEMKKYAIQYLGVPESHILVDPHARHTTTNFRNVARLALRYDFPSDRPALVTSTGSNTEYIESEKFRLRCLDELGYLPAVIGKRYSNRELEFLPDRKSLHMDPMDPLDP